MRHVHWGWGATGAAAARAVGQRARSLDAAPPSWAAAAPAEEAKTAALTGEETEASQELESAEEDEVVDGALACEAGEAAPAAAGHGGDMAAPPPVPGRGGREKPPAGGGVE